MPNCKHGVTFQKPDTFIVTTITVWTHTLSLSHSQKHTHTHTHTHTYIYVYIYDFVEITNKMQPSNRIYYSNVYWRLNMFRAAYRSSSGALNCICSLWCTCGDRPMPSPTQTWQRSVTTCVYKPEAANTVWSSWWWAVCSSKHVEPSINVWIINSITRLRLVGYFYWFVPTTLPWEEKFF